MTRVTRRTYLGTNVHFFVASESHGCSAAIHTIRRECAEPRS